MTWVKKDDFAPHHPKVRALASGRRTLDALAAYGLWDAGLAYCARHLTDGVIKKDAIHSVWPWSAHYRTLKLLMSLAAVLVEVGLWVDDGESWIVHDYLKYQPSRTEVEEKRQKTRDRVKRWRNSVTTSVAPRYPGSGSGSEIGSRSGPESEQEAYPAVDVDSAWSRYQDNRRKLNMHVNGHMHRSPADEFLLAEAVRRHGGVATVLEALDVWAEKILADEATWRREDYRLEVLLKPKNVDRALQAKTKTAPPAAPYLGRVWDGEKLVRRR